MQEFWATVAESRLTRAGIGLAGLVVLAWVANALTHRIFLGMVQRMASRTRSTMDDRLIERFTT